MKPIDDKLKRRKRLVKSSNLFPVVGVGASAGGLEAFKRLLKGIPQNSGMAYVLIQHLDPTHESLLPDLLQKVTTVPVLEVSDRISVEPDHIYIIPSNKMLVANDGVLHLQPRPGKNQRNFPIDLFFSSLAEVHQSHSIGVVLSGTGSDGTLGLKTIRDCGGLTFVQDEESASFKEMPQNAIDAKVVDFVLSPEKIPEKILDITTIIKDRGDDEKTVDGEIDEIKQILSLLRIRKGTDFTYYKQKTISRRIHRRMALTKHTEPTDYLKLVREDKTELDLLYSDLLIPVTTFFRDNKIYETLVEKIFPLIIKNKQPNEPLRIWVAGCSTGEEAYSLAICFKEFFGDKQEKVQIFATDISEQAIAKARTGVYSKSEVSELTPQRQSEFLTRSNGSYHINKEVRDMCVFAVHNFLKDPPFGKMDLISCRNVLIYMEPYLQKKALSTFHYALIPKGYLFLGKSETTASVPDLFSATARPDKLFSRNDVPNKFMPGKSEVDERVLPDSVYNRNENLHTDFQKAAYDIIFSKHTPSGVIVNEALEIVHFHGNTGEWLQLAAGKPSHNLLKLAKTGLAFELRNLLHKAKKENKSVIREKIPFKINSTQALVSLEAVPLPDVVDRHYLILFRSTTTIAKSPKKGSKKTSVANVINEKEEHIQQLEQELAQLREDMRSITEDQQSTNDELQSANEELQSGSEELQSLNEEIETSKEELQSTNEELTVVNQELLALNEQVTEERNYANGIISTVRGPLVVLDKNLKVKSANNSFYKTFMVNEHETEGKLFYDLGNSQWDIPELRSMLEGVLAKKESIQDFEITAPFPLIGRRTILLNAKEIVKEGGAEKLVLVAFEDITERTKSAAESSMLSAIVNSSADAVVSETLAGIINSWNKGAENIFGYVAQEVIGKHSSVITPGELRMEEDMALKRVRNGEQILNFDTIRIAKDGRIVNISLTLSPIIDRQGNIIGASKIARDITQQKQAEEILRNNEERFRGLVKNLPAAVYACDALGEITFYNDAAVKVWGRTPEMGKDKWCGSWKMIRMDGSPIPKEDCPMAIAFKEGRAIPGEEIWIERPDGGRSLVQVYPQPTFGLSGQKTGAINMVIDVTEQKEAARRIKESEENFHQLAELTPEKVSALDPQGKLIYFNKRWRDYTGLNSEELINLKLDEFIHPDGRVEFAAMWNHSLETGNDLEMEMRLRNSSGEYKWHLIHTVAVKDETGMLTKWISTATEIQSQKKQQEELEETVLKRTYELQQLNGTLQRQNSELQKMNKELESFTYISSHDLQEPLRKIQTFTSWVLEREYASLSEKGKDYFDRISSAALRMQTLIHDLLSYSRTANIKKKFLRKDLSKVVEQVKMDLQELFDQRDATLEAQDLGEAIIIPFQFHQMMHNLISNSFKFSIPGRPLRIIIKSEIARGNELLESNNRLEALRLSPEKNYCHISVSDNGIGFEPEYGERIFELFQRLHSKEEYQGTGVGLAIVKRIVENHSGAITATGELNRGAVFDIYIPDF